MFENLIYQLIKGDEVSSSLELQFEWLF